MKTINPITSKLLIKEKVIHGFFTRNGSLDKNIKNDFNCSFKYWSGFKKKF